MKQLGLGESALRWGGRLSAFVAMLALGRHSTLDLHLHWPTGHFRMRCIYGLGKHLSESVIEYSNGLGAYDPALAIHVSSGVLMMYFFFASVFHFFATKCAFCHNQFSTLFFSMKTTESEKIGLVSCIIDFKEVQV